MTVYAEEDYLPLSGLQHFAFCRRQWALITLEQQWKDNRLTAEGDILHERAHDEALAEKRGSLLTVRGLRVQSPTLGVAGACDVVEFTADEGGVPLAGREGRWRPYLVEYKRGESKQIDADRLQLCAQAMCLEEMLGCAIPESALYYAQPRRREPVALTPALRETVRGMLSEMHALKARGTTPKVKPGPGCRACSLSELCLPRLAKHPPVGDYLRASLGEDTP